ncbi:TetR family transcriptional regulator [Pseudomonas sp. Bc-h]|uniref:CerR family C-terminal domain-containing protein n=1 Tax=Pseudomonas sp. Bc-h TaxID=1943632 RepID=UPI0009DA9AF4|nr:CerR family C-terminal domain-containing protein [Pseudomonas sp. Bc-h]OQR36627.1 TetR family transcriptional regulator [Pseudomonas sp. Bc-h]
MARHRPASEGGYQRGEETRAAILLAAVAVFGERGYEGASTRDIAKAAGVNAPSIQYYFDSKEGVYLQCVEHLITLLWQKMGAAVDAAERAVGDGTSSDQMLIEGAIGILGAVLSTTKDTTQIRAWRIFFDRQQAGLCPPSATVIFERKFKARIDSVMRLLIARLSGFEVGDERTILHSTALFTQGLAFRAHKSRLLSALNWKEVDHKEMELIRSIVLTQARFTLEGLARQSLSPPH